MSLRKRVKRDRVKIKHELELKGYNWTSLARELGVSPALVQGTADGWQNNRRVLKKFLEIGVSKDLLELPKDLKQEEAA